MRNDLASVGNESLAQGQQEESGIRTILPHGWLWRWTWHVVARQFTLFSVLALTVAGWVGRKRRPPSGAACEVLLTGRFDSTNWILHHLIPLAASAQCMRVWMVSTNPIPPLPKVVAVYSPRWLRTVVGATPARLLTFMWVAVRRRPHILGGFHIMVNGIVAVIMGRLLGARALYFCVGGPAEISGGGVHSAENLFAKMKTPDALVERRLLRIIAESDMVITMGTGAVRFFRDKGIDTDFHVVSGGIDSQRFRPAEEAPFYDVIVTGRLVEIKRIDILLYAVKTVQKRIPDVRVVVVGDGALRGHLQALSVDLRLDRNVSFVGHQAAVEDWLRRARIFVLTSDSEGLSLAMMEAMMCGLPAVVSDVGDLGDLVEDGVNGFLVPRRAPELFADRLVELLSDEPKLRSFSQAARRAALRYETQATIKHWDRILADL